MLFSSRELSPAVPAIAGCCQSICSGVRASVSSLELAVCWKPIGTGQATGRELRLLH